MHVRIDDSGIFHFAGGAEIAPAAKPGDTTAAHVRSTLTIAEHPWMDISFRRRD